jgi:hypothetical protein
MTAQPPITHFGEDMAACGIQTMEDSSALLDQTDALNARMQRQGYLYFKGFHPREEVLAGRRVVAQQLHASGALAPDTDPMDLQIASGTRLPSFKGGVLKGLFPDGWETLHDTLFTGKRMALFRAMFGEEPRPYDYTWMRLVNAGPSSKIHADSVYMGRGTHEVFTCWTPWGDNPPEMGGLILLEGSHQRDDLLGGYWHSDVDAFCANSELKQDGWATSHGGAIRGTALSLWQLLGGRWVTADFEAGDIVVFSIRTVHGGADNHTQRVRLSTDTRYQRASAAIDERWVGDMPAGHGPAGKRGVIC